MANCILIVFHVLIISLYQPFLMLNSLIGFFSLIKAFIIIIITKELCPLN